MLSSEGATLTLRREPRFEGVGALVRIADDAGLWRVREVAVEAMIVRLDLVRLAFGAMTLPASSGRAQLAPDLSAGETQVEVIELPPMDGGAHTPQLFVAACGTGAGWRGAALSTSVDAGASWQAAGRTQGIATLGVLVTAPQAAPSTLVDRVSVIVVQLHMPGAVLRDADRGALDAGSNLALIGEELVQFARAEPLGSGRWRLSGLWRGRRGTEFAVGTQQPGDRFVLIETDALLPVGSIGAVPGREVRVLANGIGDPGGRIERTHVVSGWSVRPPAPVHAVATGGVGTARTLRWVRRSRAGWTWSDLIDVPLGEERERYRCDWGTGTAELSEPIFEVPVGVHAITVRQLGTAAASLPLVATVG